eukprot:TRINITY_DN670_c0_g2_i1.p1 TRINITY_DN670_c0_g2~~TRINITY_DN670_c0_g2_i1.p1  ORF type:complete len:965 (+),score=219.98 TRINITY_DN670_c0_g2_i1:80-2896(+)
MAPASRPQKVPKYHSTRGGQKDLDFEDAVFEGLARDGGLLVPDWVPDVSAVYKTWANLSFHDLAFEIVSHFCDEATIPSDDLRALMKKSYAHPEIFTHKDVVPNVQVGDMKIMELFHGPTFSFKDVALQGLGNFYEYFLKRKPNRRLTIICATSGDTGSAAIYGLRGKEKVNVFVLYPEGRISPVQQQQMTTVTDDNVHCMSVQGTFDDCQDIVKTLLANQELKRKFGLGAVNSINWARIMLQITYYFWTYFKLYPRCDGKMSFSVPTGNFGDILAGYYAKRMGLPVADLVVATNDNDILHRFFTKGEYDKSDVRQTITPSMDIQISSNFERYLYYLFDENSMRLEMAMLEFRKTGKLHVDEALRKRASDDFLSGATNEAGVSKTVSSYYKQHNYMLDPHTACGVSAVEQVRSSLTEGAEMVVLGTAHPAKFHEPVSKAIGKEIPLPPALDASMKLKGRAQSLSASVQAVHSAMERALYYRGTYMLHNERMSCEDSCDSLPGEPGMWLVALDVEGTLMGEAWLELQKKTGIEELKRTTAHEPDYDKLMMYRIEALRKNNVKLQDMKDVVRGMQPLPGCKEFLAWLRTLVPRVLLLTDTFEEYAMPMFEALGYPCVFCNSLTVNEEGFITGHILRLRDQKRKAVESFQRLNFRVIAIGDSFNDVSMMKAAERGIFMNPSEKALQAYPDFPACWNYNDLKARIMEIVCDPPAIPPQPLAVPAPLDFECSHRSMYLVLANVAGTFAPEPWPVMHAVTGIEELATTSAHVPDFAGLMELRAKVMREHGIKLQKLYDVLQAIEPLPGAKDFMAWLKPVVPRAFMMTDTFEEYAVPVFSKLGHPMVLCNFLEADKEGYMTKHVIRKKDQKRLAVEEFTRLNFRVIAVGASFNDIPMLKAAEHGILFNPSTHLREGHPDITAVKNYEELKARILEIVTRKRKAMD